MNAQTNSSMSGLFRLKNFPLSVIALGLLITALAADRLTAADSSASTPALNVLPKFTSSDVPETGPEEIPIDPPKYTLTEPAQGLPGKGLAQHPMLYIGEGCNKMFLINDGKVIWTYSTGKGWEYDDIWMLSNGNILFSRMAYAAEVTPQKKIVWRLDPPKGAEIHSVQPIGLDKVFVVQNGSPAKIMIVDKKTGRVEMEHELSPEITGTAVHGQFRRGRVTAQGTYLLSFLQKGRVVEYDKDFNEIWSYATPSPWAAIRLKNGNTLISVESKEQLLEVNPKGETVWKFDIKTDVPPEFGFAASQSCVRLANGNTILCSRAKPGKGPQLVEVTPDKKVVWVLDDWTNLGPATAIQILDDPGVPENPGDCQR
jgi:outer membrane protein assembly factor BamB